MSSITTIQPDDLITDSREDINNNFTALNNEKIETSYLDTDTSLTANSDTKIPTQKAVKAYVDTGGVANASETVKGLVEEATDAEVIAGTATGATGAKLFVTPAKLATASGETGVSKLVKTKSTGLLDPSIIPPPAFQQIIPLLSGSFNGDEEIHFGSNQDGSVFFLQLNSGSLLRYQRDDLTGFYGYSGHNESPATPVDDRGGIVVLGNYVYVFTNDGTNVICTRYLAADLSGSQAMTVPTVACTAVLSVYTDGTYVYITSANAATTTHKWSLSGTTFSAVSTAVTSDLVGSTDGAHENVSSMFDGTNIYIIRGKDPDTAKTIYKLTNPDGSSKTTVTKYWGLIGSSHLCSMIVNIDSTKMYIGYLYINYNELNADAQITPIINLFPVSKF